MRINKYILISSLAALVCMQSLHADTFSISPVVGLNLSNVSIDPAPANPFSYGLSFEGGVLGSMPLMPMLSLELGALYVSHKQTISAGANSASTTEKGLEIPLLVRCTALPIVSFGLGGYFGLGLGDLSSHTEIGGVVTDTTTTYDAGNVSKTDFGLVGSVAAEIPIVPMVSLLLDVRYLFGLKNVDTTPNSTGSSKYRDIEFLAGATFGF